MTVFARLNSKSNTVLLGSGNITVSGQTIQLSDSIQNYAAIVISSNETTPSMMPASAISIGTTVFYLHGSSGTNLKVNTVKFQSDDVLISTSVGIAFPVYIFGIR